MSKDGELSVYFTASFRFFPALNTGTFFAAILVTLPVTIHSHLPEINLNHADKRRLPFKALNSMAQRKIVEEGSRILQEQQISCHAFAHFIRYSIKCSGDPVSTLVFEVLNPYKKVNSDTFRKLCFVVVFYNCYQIDLVL
jgi:hypothetical protein